MMRPLLSRLRRHDGGVAVIELALTMPLFMVMIMGVADMSTAYSRRLALEQGAQRAIEMIQQTTGNDSVEGAVQAEAADQAGVTPDDVSVSFQLFCDGDLAGDFEAECAGTAVETRYIIVTVSDRYDPFFPGILGAVDDQGLYPISATAGIRTK
jgi:hypothetical protein